jgi:dimethylargininase
VLDYDLPYLSGPEACLHLLSLISPLDVDLAVAYPPLLPIALWEELQRRGIRLLEVPEDEFAGTQATNILAVAPRRCIMLDDNPVTRQLLVEADCEVVTFPGAPLSLKAEGGPTCLTRPVLRDPE